MQNTKPGFSIIEWLIVILSVALTVMAFIILSSMLESSKIQGVITQATNYNIRIHQFRSTYAYYPGDYPKAYTTFGYECADGIARNCNGNGDGIVDQDSEDLVFWQHLRLANLIKDEIKYKRNLIVGMNIPRSTLSNITGYAPGLKKICVQDNVMSISLAGYARDLSGNLDGGAMSPINARMIDAKIDDGNPAYGKVTVDRSYLDAGSPNLCVSISPSQGCDMYASRTYTADERLGCIVHFSLDSIK